MSRVFARTSKSSGLLDLGFFEDHVLTHNGVVLAELELVRGVTLVFLGGVEKTGSCGGYEFDLVAS